MTAWPRYALASMTTMPPGPTAVVDVGDRPRQPAVMKHPPAGSAELVEDRTDDALALQPAGLALGLKVAGLRLLFVFVGLQHQVASSLLMLLGAGEVALA